MITPSGSVPSYWEKYEPVKAAKRVYGVRAVVDEIEVKLPGSSERTDSDIAEAAVRALKNNLSVPDDKIKVTVREGWITPTRASDVYGVRFDDEGWLDEPATSALRRRMRPGPGA